MGFDCLDFLLFIYFSGYRREIRKEKYFQILRRTPQELSD